MLVHEAVSLHADMQSHWTDVLVLHDASGTFLPCVVPCRAHRACFEACFEPCESGTAGVIAFTYC